MKIKVLKNLSIIAVAVAGAMALAGCRQKPAAEQSKTVGVGERAGAALDKAAEKTAEAGKAAATTTKEAAGKVVEKTGEVLEKAGAATEKAGANMQK